eukprot:COSAG04_NODE_835_length_9985_cov_10.447603_1_plen_102_part_10
MEGADPKDQSSGQAMGAIEFCQGTPSARVAVVWPTGHAEIATARAFLEKQQGKIVHEAEVRLEEHAQILLVMALYHGEAWLSSNCYYWESPLRARPSPPPPP